VVVTAVVVAVAVTPGAFGFGIAPQQSAPKANSRVIAVDVDIRPKTAKTLHRSTKPAPVKAAPAPAPAAPAPAPMAAPRAMAQAPEPDPAPTAVDGRRQQQAAKPEPRTTDSAPSTIDARPTPPSDVPQSPNLHGTD
jgi:hypothetical protein